MNWDKEEKPTDSTFTELSLFKLNIKSTTRATKSRERFTLDFPRGFPAHSRTPPLLLSNKTEDLGGVVNLSGLQWVIMGLTSIRTQSSFMEAKKEINKRENTGVQHVSPATSGRREWAIL